MSAVAQARRPGHTEAIERVVSAFERSLTEGGPEPSWLAETRRRAMNRFLEHGFPTAREEDWKFTSVAPIVETRFTVAPGLVEVPSARVAPFSIGEASIELVFVNGHFAPRLSRFGGLPPGLRVDTIASALSEAAHELKPQLGQAGFEENAAFTALNAAFARDGAFVRLAPHVVVESPIHVLFLTTAGSEPMAISPRMIVLVGEDSQARIVETYAGLDELVSLTNAVTEFVVGPQAVVDHYKVQQEAFHGYHVGTQHVRAARGSTFSSHSLTFGGAIVRNEVVAVLDGEGVDCTLNGLYLAGGNQLIDNHTTIDHATPHCGSHELYKGILNGRARGVFNGKIVVRPDAQKTDAKQTNRALLLSNDAQINSKPQLEIFANDVKCTHGATIGQLDDDAIFYLRSRGLDSSQARSLLIHAFAREILDRVRIDSLRVRLERALESQLDIEQS